MTCPVNLIRGSVFQCSVQKQNVWKRDFVSANIKEKIVWWLTYISRKFNWSFCTSLILKNNETEFIQKFNIFLNILTKIFFPLYHIFLSILNKNVCTHNSNTATIVVRHWLTACYAGAFEPSFSALFRIFSMNAGILLVYTH